MTEASILDMLSKVLKTPQNVELSLHNSNFDVYQHLNAAVYPDLVETAMLNLLRSAPSAELSRSPRSAYINRSVAVEYRRAIPLSAAAVVVTLAAAETANEPGCFAIDFKILAAGSACAVGRVILAEKHHDFLAPSLSPGVTAMGKSIVYQWDLPVLNNDRSPDRAVGPGRVLDGVLSSRWYAVKQRCGVTIDEWIAKGLGFFLTKAHIDLLLPVRELGYLTYRSWVAEIAAGETMITIPFQVHATSSGQLHAQGTLMCAVMDLATAKPQKRALPDYAKECFFKL